MIHRTNCYLNQSLFFALFLCLVSAETAIAQARLEVDTTQVLKPVNPNVFGISIPSLYRSRHGYKVDLSSTELKNYLNQLKSPFVTIQNTSLGLPFYPESTGNYSKRLSLMDTVLKMDLNSHPLGMEFYNTYKNKPEVNKPTEQNYDDLLGYLETLDVKPGVSLRVPTVFTALKKPWSEMHLKIEAETGANLVHYLNDPSTTRLGKLRADNGHPEPYNIKKFVLGNELWNNVAYGLSPQAIVSQHKNFYRAMKQADPSIEIGFNLIDEEFPREMFKSDVLNSASILMEFNGYMLGQLKDYIDFVTVHSYSDYGIAQDGGSLVSMQDEKWSYVLSLIHLKRKYNAIGNLKNTLNSYQSGLKLAIDEYSGPLASLGGAIYITDYIMYLLEEDVDYATHWNLGLFEPHTYFGAIKAVDYEDKTVYSKRPIYMALQLFTDFVEGGLVKTNLESPDFPIGDVSVSNLIRWSKDEQIPSLHALASYTGKNLIVIVINRHCDSDITTEINLKGFTPGPVAGVKTLNAPNLNSNNEQTHNKVSITTSQLRDKGATFSYNFPAHSITLFKFIKL